MKSVKVFIRLLILLLVSAFTVYGQESRMFSDIRKAKESNIDFPRITNLFTEATEGDKSVKANFVDEEVYFFNYSPSALKNMPTAFTLVIPKGNAELQLELLEVLDDTDYDIQTSDGRSFKSSELNTNYKHYRGIVKNLSNSIVDITCFDNEIMGLVCTDEGNYNIALESLSGKHILFNDKKLKEHPDFECATIDDPMIDYDPATLLQDPKISKGVLAGSNRYIKLYIETKYNLFQSKGSVSAVNSYITGIMNQAGTLYRNEEINVTISTLYIWSSQDPYTSTSTDVLLTQFQSNRTSISGDLGQLIDLRNEMVGNGDGIAAGFAGLCNSSTANKLSVAGIYASYNNVPIYSWTVQVITHEFGHLFGSRHTHACVWNNNNTAIDGCAGYTEPRDGCPLPPIPSNGGTIMSYCNWPSAGVGINFNLGFGPQPGNLIRNKISNANCLSIMTLSGPDNIPFSGGATYTLSVSLLNPKWTVSNGLEITNSSSYSVTVHATATSYTAASISVNGIVLRAITIGSY
jgi:hypothetical protein